jgi:hypothetical protein
MILGSIARMPAAAAVLAIVMLAAASCSDDDPAAPSTDPVCDLSPETLDFGTVAVGDDMDLSCTLKNRGGGTLSGEITEACGHYSIVSGEGAFSLGKGDSVVVTVRFSPGEEGTFNCTAATGLTGCPGISCTGSAQYSWENIYSNVYQAWYGIWGSSASDIFVVGYEIRHFDGSDWTTVSNPSLDKTLYDVWGTGPNNVYAVGHDYFSNEGVIVHYDGNGWSIEEDDLSVGFLDIWGSGPNDIYAVGIGGTAYYKDESGWEPFFIGGSVSHAIWGRSASDVFIVGDTGRIQHNNGSMWEGMTSGTSYALLGVWGLPGAADSPAYVTTISTEILSYNGTSWTQMQNDGSGDGMEDIWGTSATDLYCAGYAGRIMHFDGTSWKDMLSPSSGLLEGIWGTSPTNIYAVSANGDILHYTGGS